MLTTDQLMTALLVLPSMWSDVMLEDGSVTIPHGASQSHPSCADRDTCHHDLFPRSRLPPYLLCLQEQQMFSSARHVATVGYLGASS